MFSQSQKPDQTRMAISVPEPANNHSPESVFQKKVPNSLEQTPVNK